jgi:eukaryotic-like serine/threonine-protein kinase
MPFHCVRCNREIDRSFKACPHCGEPVTDFLREYADKPIDGKYRIVSRLGTGGMGEVYKVEHTFLGAIRVIKVIRPQISESGDAHDRFLREARLATKVHHPNVATLHDFAALPDGSHYMVWEFIDGENLAQVIRRRGVLPPREAVDIMKQALAGLEAIHRAGIVHRDISPENVMITGDTDSRERVKIIDLGVAKGEDSETSSMTKTGIFVGKLRYCSPEHLGFLGEGEKIDGRADLYSLAIVLVEVLTGRPPFEATSPHQYIVHHSRDTELKPIELGNVPAGLRPVIGRALERDRNKRFASAREFADALEHVELPAAFDADSTMRLTPPQAEVPTMVDTHPTPLPRPPTPTIAAPAPVPVPAPPPTQAPAPEGAAAYTPPAAAPRSGSPALLVVFFVVLFLAVLATGGVLFFLKPRPAPVAQHTATTTQAAVVPAPVPQSQTTVDVTATTALIPPATVTTATTVTTVTTPPVQVATPVPLPVPVQTKPKPQPRPADTTTESAEGEERDEEATSSTSFPTYTEGGAAIVNESAINVARMQLKNVKQVALIGNGGHAVLMNQVAEYLRDSGLTVIDGADVVIYFNAQLDHLGRGRKRRSAEVTITRHGRPVLRYVMPAEEYRVGDNPAEAFGRIVSEIFTR